MRRALLALTLVVLSAGVYTAVALAATPWPVSSNRQ